MTIISDIHEWMLDREKSLVQKDARHSFLKNEIAELEERVNILKLDNVILEESLTVLREIVAILKHETTEKIEGLVERGLQIILDSKVVFRILEKTTPKMIKYYFSLNDGKYVSENISQEKGGGIQNIVSFLITFILAFLLTPKNMRLFVLDERFAQLSSNYLSGIGELLQSLVVDFGCQFLMVTHRNQLVPYADQVYKTEICSSGSWALKEAVS